MIAKKGILVITLTAAIFALLPLAKPQDELPAAPWIFGHRGSAGSLPEHTLEGYALGIAQGAHFVECDVVLTKDCQPICRHEPDLSQTTDALHKYPHLVRNKTVDGTETQGVFTTDLTLSQIKTLRAKERLDARTYNQQYNFDYTIPTLQEYFDVVKNASLAASRVVGVVPETKHPTWFSQQDLPCLQDSNISSILLDALRKNGYEHPFNTTEWRRAPAIIQSFEIENLQWLNSTSAIPLLQLLDEADLETADSFTPYASLMSDDGLASVAAYATFLGPWKGSQNPPDGSAADLVAANLTRRAQEQGLLVTPYTFRNDDPWNATEQAEGAPENEYRYFLDVVGIDGGFSDFPETFAYVLNNRRSSESQTVSTNSV